MAIYLSDYTLVQDWPRRVRLCRCPITPAYTSYARARVVRYAPAPVPGGFMPCDYMLQKKYGSASKPFAVLYDCCPPLHDIDTRWIDRLKQTPTSGRHTTARL
eukprot:scaffold10547_cov58-Phaeocystis_antarctica.AAC.2